MRTDQLDENSFQEAWSIHFVNCLELNFQCSDSVSFLSVFFSRILLSRWICFQDRLRIWSSLCYLFKNVQKLLNMIRNNDIDIKKLSWSVWRSSWMIRFWRSSLRDFVLLLNLECAWHSEVWIWSIKNEWINVNM